MLISIDKNDPRPIYVQIATAIKEQVCRGQLKPDEELPSVRELAEALDVNLHTIRHAYKVLAEQNVVRLGLARRARILPPAETPPDASLIEQRLLPRLREIVADAVQLGLSDNDLHQLIDQAISATKKRKTK